MRVLVPVDGSGNSMRAVDFALQMAKGDPAVDVTLLAVSCEYDYHNFIDYPLDGVSLYKQCQERFKEALAKASQVFTDAGVKVKTELISGDPGAAISDYVERNDVDRVIMGSRGLSPLEGLILGSVAYKVLHRVKVPVTIVK